MREQDEITRWLKAARAGDKDAERQLYQALYGNLRALARSIEHASRDGQSHATSLVHELYERFARPEALDVRDREHLMAVAARAMRQLVVDRARRAVAVKRGGELAIEPLDEQHELPDPRSAEHALQLERALEELARRELALVRLVELRFFAGLEVEQVAALWGRSESSLKRDWRRARAFLHARLGAAPESAP